MSLPHSENLDEYDKLLKVLGEKSIQIGDLWHFSNATKLGHNIVQALGTNNRDYAYQSLQEVANLAWEWTQKDGKSSLSYRSICIPAIIIEGSLYEASCHPDTLEFNVQEREYGRVSWSGANNGTMVDVVTKKGLGQWAEYIKETITMFKETFETITSHIEVPRASGGLR